MEARSWRCAIFDKLIDIILQFLHFFQFLHVVRAYQEGIVLRFGRFHRVRGPGLAWVWPFYIEEIYTTGVVDEPIMVGPQSLTTADGVQVVTSALFVISVNDVKKFLLEFEGGNLGILLLGHGAVAELVESHTWDELSKRVADEDDEVVQNPKLPVSISRKLAHCLRRRSNKYGVGVTRAQVIELTRAKSLRLMGMNEGGGLAVK